MLANNGREKTILVVGSYFPYMTRRLKVISRKIIELSPLQNSLETIQQRIQALRLELANPHLEAKIFQPVLQGAVSPVVHQGPRSICKAFLEEKKGEYQPEELKKLKEELIDLIEVCKDALARNQDDLMKTDLDKELHEQFVQGFNELKDYMEKFIYD